MPKRIICDVSNPKKVVQREEDFEFTQEELDQQAISQAQQAQEEQRETNRVTLQDRARNAIAANKAYLDSTPTTAQALAQVDAITRQVNALIRLVVNELDSAD